MADTYRLQIVYCIFTYIYIYSFLHTYIDIHTYYTLPETITYVAPEKGCFLLVSRSGGDVFWHP